MFRAAMALEQLLDEVALLSLMNCRSQVELGLLGIKGMATMIQVPVIVTARRINTTHLYNKC